MIVGSAKALSARFAAAALVGSLALGGCATPPREPGESPWTSGRLSVKVDANADHAAQSVNASFDLRGDGDRGELRLGSALGTQVAVARWAPGSAVLISSDGERRFDDLSQLSREALGEDVPLRALNDWLAGRPWSGSPSTPTETGFSQLGWTVTLTRQAEGFIEMLRGAPSAIAVRVRLDDPR